MAVNKVEYAGKVLLDLTEDTVTEDQLLEGATAHDRSGQRIVGALINLAEDTVAPENLLAGATAHDSSGQRIVGTMEVDSGGGGNTKMVTGTTSSPAINTGLSKIDKLIIYANKIASKGMVDMIYNSDSSRAVTTFCGEYSVYSQYCKVTERTGFSVAGGTFNWTETMDEYKFMNNATYNWIAIGS